MRDVDLYRAVSLCREFVADGLDLDRAVRAAAGQIGASPSILLRLVAAAEIGCLRARLDRAEQELERLEPETTEVGDE